MVVQVMDVATLGPPGGGAGLIPPPRVTQLMNTAATSRSMNYSARHSSTCTTTTSTTLNTVTAKYNVTRNTVTSHIATNQYTQHPAFLRHRLLLRAAELQMGGGGEHSHQHISHQLYCAAPHHNTQ